jgi:hypothetical protein
MHNEAFIGADFKFNSARAIVSPVANPQHLRKRLNGSSECANIADTSMGPSHANLGIKKSERGRPFTFIPSLSASIKSSARPRVKEPGFLRGKREIRFHEVVSPLPPRFRASPLFFTSSVEPWPNPGPSLRASNRYFDSQYFQPPYFHYFYKNFLSLSLNVRYTNPCSFPPSFAPWIFTSKFYDLPNRSEYRNLIELNGLAFTTYNMAEETQ